MTSQLSLVKSELFERNSADFYSNSDTYFMTAKQLSQCLGYASKTAFDSLLSRNKYLNDEEFSTTCNLQVVEGNRTVTRNMRLFSEDGIYEIAFLSKTAVAQMFRAWVRKILKELRQQTKQSQQLTTTNPLLEQSVYHLQQSIQNTIDCAYKQGIQIGEHEARIESLESRPVINAELIDQVQLVISNYMYHPIYQRMFHEIVKMEGRYHQLNQQIRAIRADLSLHYKEHNPEAYAKPKKSKSKTTTPAVTYFNSIETLFNDMKDTYQSFTTFQTVQSENSEPMIVSTLIFRLVEIYEDHLHFQVNKHNTACMDVFGIIKAEKRILDSHGVAEYKVYCDGGVEPVVFQAVPKRIVGGG